MRRLPGGSAGGRSGDDAGMRRRRGPVSGAVALVVAVTLVGGCSGGSTPSGPAPSSTSASATSTSVPTSALSPSSGGATSTTGRTITVTVTGSTVRPAPAQVDLAVGETLTLVVTSDHDDELHAHGFEIEKPLVAGTPTTISVTGSQTGVFEVETHEPPLTLLTIAVR